jgi:hypothetical protein
MNSANGARGRNRALEIAYTFIEQMITDVLPFEWQSILACCTFQTRALILCILPLFRVGASVSSNAAISYICSISIIAEWERLFAEQISMCYINEELDAFVAGLLRAFEIGGTFDLKDGIPLGLHPEQDSMRLRRRKFAGFDLEGEAILRRWPWASGNRSESARGCVSAIEIDRDATRSIRLGDV